MKTYTYPTLQKGNTKLVESCLVFFFSPPWNAIKENLTLKYPDYYATVLEQRGFKFCSSFPHPVWASWMQGCWLFLRWICWFFSAQVLLVWINNKKEASPLLALQMISSLWFNSLFIYTKWRSSKRRRWDAHHNCIVWDPSPSSLSWGWGDTSAWECPCIAILLTLSKGAQKFFPGTLQWYWHTSTRVFGVWKLLFSSEK